jgi:hypothetical protein
LRQAPFIRNRSSAFIGTADLRRRVAQLWQAAAIA